MSIRNKIRKFIENSLDEQQANRLNDLHNVTFLDTDDWFERKMVNSLFAMRLLHYLEKEFSITIEEVDLEPKNFSSVNNVLLFLEKKGVVEEKTACI